MQVYQHLPEIKLIVATVLHTIIYYSKTIQHFNILSYERETVLPEMQEGKSVVGFITSNHLGIGLLHHTYHFTNSKSSSTKKFLMILSVLIVPILLSFITQGSGALNFP